MNADLLGDPIQEPRSTTTPRGYRADPGTGPKGETCGTCKHYARVCRGAGTFRKCGLMKLAWTRGPGTDILKKSAACRFWEGG